MAQWWYRREWFVIRLYNFIRFKIGFSVISRDVSLSVLIEIIARGAFCADSGGVCIGSKRFSQEKKGVSFSRIWVEELLSLLS